MAQNARRRLTCESAPERAHLCRSRCCFASSMDTKIAQNRRKFHTKLSQKMRGPVLQWSKTEAVERPAKMQHNAFIFLVPGVALFTPWMQKSLESYALRSCPPRGGPIRSVLSQKNKAAMRCAAGSAATAGNCCGKSLGSTFFAAASNFGCKLRQCTQFGLWNITITRSFRATSSLRSSD